jgi:hypothetical protein
MLTRLDVLHELLKCDLRQQRNPFLRYLFTMHVFIYFIHKINEGGFTITEILFAAFYFLEKPFGSA